jgi:fumarate hydratase class II
MALRRDLIPAVERVERAIAAKAAEFADVVKIGRTHLQDAVPLTMGQEMSGWSSLLERDVDRLRAALDGLYDLALGGTAVGTGLNAPPQFATRVTAALAALTGLPFRPHPNLFAALSASDELVFAGAAVATLAGSLLKIANDIRLLASGPRAGLGELVLPANEPGSSIMPGKVNPTQCEAMAMVCVQVLGYQTAIAMAGSQGHLELNTYRPLMIHDFLQAARLLTDACGSFVDHLLDGLGIDRARIAAHVRNSLMLVTALAPRLGYDRAAEVAHLAAADGLTLRAAAEKLGYLSGEEFDALVRPDAMTGR